MKLIKISSDHYIIVDDSEIKEGDWVLDVYDNSIKLISNTVILPLDKDYWKKITHSTQPIEQYYGAADGTIPFVYHKIIELLLSEVKELIGEKSWKGYIDGTEWEVEFIDGKLKLIK
jgi:hypothetical protein